MTRKSKKKSEKKSVRRRRYKFAGEDDEKEKQKEEKEEEKEKEEDQKIEIEMDRPARYGGKNIPGCNDVYEFGKLKLCWCDSFNQYCITFSSGRSRLFTVIGEQHYPILDDHDKRFETPCQSEEYANMIDSYVQLIDHVSTKIGKTVNVYTELSPTLDLPFQSYNLWRLKEFHKINPQILYIPMDIREILQNDFSRQMYNQNFQDLTLSDLQAQQKDDCYFRSVLLHFLNKLIRVGGRVSNKERYEPAHFKLIQTAYQQLIQTFDSIRPMIQTLRSRDVKMSLKIKDVFDHNRIVQKIVETYRNSFASVLDLYILIQVLRKDYMADHIIFLVGEMHARNLFQFLHPFRIFSGPSFSSSSSCPLIDLSGSYY
jgi:hypothetical protein